MLYTPIFLYTLFYFLITPFPISPLCLGVDYGMLCTCMSFHVVIVVYRTWPIQVSVRRLLLLAVVRPSLEYGDEIWECEKGQANALESVLLGGAK